MTITELLLTNPGVQLKFRYSATVGVFYVTAAHNGRIHPVVLTPKEAAEPCEFEDAIKRAMEAVR